MALKIKLAIPTGSHPWAELRWSSWLVALVSAGRCSSASSAWRVHATTTSSTQRIVDERLKQPLFANTAKIYAAPREVRPGQKLSAHADCRTNCAQAGYTVDGLAQPSPMGTFTESDGSDHGSSRARSPITPDDAPPSTSATAWSTPSPTTMGSRSPAMSWSRC